MQKFGGLPLGIDDVMGVVRIGVERAKWLEGEVERALKEDWEGRKGKVEGW
jgi:exosome complex component RRP45